MREMSRLAPGIFSMSCTPMTKRLTGLSVVRLRGEGLTVTSPSICASSSSSTSMKGVRADTIYSAVSFSLYPMHDTTSR